jgi:hypothetical protein
MIFLHQQFGCEPGILATATANGDVNSVADEIRQPLRRRHPHVNIAVDPPKPRQPGHQPSGRERESIVLTLTVPDVCPVAADVAATTCSRTSRISAAKDAPIGVSRTERVARATYSILVRDGDQPKIMKETVTVAVP